MKASILTYHSAYNFGSALQAYALQQKLRSMDIFADILNYRMAEQKYYYQNSIHFRYGYRTAIKDCIQVSFKKVRDGRSERAEKFEQFIQNDLQTTEEIQDPEQVASQWRQYDTIISGSDQILNKHSCELEHNDWRYMDPYLLKGFEGRKVSYASSIGGMTDKELQRILPELRQFDHLSFRERVSAEKMAALLERPVEAVIDPTFLLTKDDWIEHLRLKKESEEEYILGYLLGGPKQLSRLLPILSQFAKKQNCKVKVVAPFAYLPCSDKRIEYHLEFGPIEFLNALYNAKAVVTDSYHGTVLSANFGKEFYSLCKSGGAIYRKTDILNRLGLQDRVIYDADKIMELALSPIDYHPVNTKLDTLRQYSVNYLINALEG